MNTLTIADIASDLRLSPRTVQRYCKEGFLPARLSVNQSQLSYEVDSSDYLNWKTKHFSGLKKGEASKYTRQTKELTLDGLRAASEEWLEWSIAGKINGKPIGLRTIEIYRYYFNLYLKRLGKNPKKPPGLIHSNTA